MKIYNTGTAQKRQTGTFAPFSDLHFFPDSYPFRCIPHMDEEKKYIFKVQTHQNWPWFFFQLAYLNNLSDFHTSLWQFCYVLAIMWKMLKSKVESANFVCNIVIRRYDKFTPCWENQNLNVAIMCRRCEIVNNFFPLKYHHIIQN